MIENNDLKKRIVDISYKHKLNHIGSCICSVDTIKEIYDEMGPNDKFILSAGHAGLALYVVLESQARKVVKDKFKNIANPNAINTAESMIKAIGVHPSRDLDDSDSSIDCSTGSLGQGLPIAVGMAIADRTRTVYCVISDGESMEGSIWESLRIIHDMNISNIKVYMIVNGWGAYGPIEIDSLYTRVKAFLPSIRFRDTRMELEQIPVIGEIGNEAHYRVLDEPSYHKIMEVLNG